MCQRNKTTRQVLGFELKILISITTLCFLLTACDGGGQIGGATLTSNELHPSSGSTQKPYPDRNINGSVQGEIWDSAEGIRVDVSTGESVRVSAYENPVYPRADGREYVELEQKYRYYGSESCGGFLGSHSTAIKIRDSSTLQVTDFMEMRLRLHGPVLLSPDGQTLAAWAQPFDECADDDDGYVQLFNRTGEYIRYSKNVLGFDWMPDNRLAYIAYKDGAYKLGVQKERDTFDAWVLATLPPLGGSPTRFRVSPDGQQVLFEVVSGTPHFLTAFDFREATVWIMDIDGANLRQLADTSRPSLYNDIDYDDPLINQPVWSLDSQHVLVTEGYKTGATFLTDSIDATQPSIDLLEAITVNLPFTTYLMPTNSALTRLPPSAVSATGVRPLLWSDGRDKLSALTMNPMERHSWTPKVEQAAESSPGNYLRRNGQVNHGLTGTIYYDASEEDKENGVITKINLVTNQRMAVQLEDGTDYGEVWKFDVSKSENSIAVIYEDSREVDVIAFFDSAGRNTAKIDLKTDAYDYTEHWNNRLQLSPANEDIIGWQFISEYEAGVDQEWGVVIYDRKTNNITNKFQKFRAFSWFPNGDLLLVDRGGMFKAAKVDGGFSEPKFMFATANDIFRIDVTPDGNRLLISSNGQVVSTDLRGENQKKLTATTAVRYSVGAQSPDGRVLIVGGREENGPDENAGPSDFVGADAQNLFLYGDYTQVGVIPKSEILGDYAYGYKWR